jgi:hypothetical protein
MKTKIITIIMIGLLATTLVRAEDTLTAPENAEIQTLDVTPDSATITDIDIAPVQTAVTAVQPMLDTPQAISLEQPAVNATATQDWGPFQWIIDWFNTLWS